jgi:hypothetical protein
VKRRSILKFVVVISIVLFAAMVVFQINSTLQEAHLVEYRKHDCAERLRTIGAALLSYAEKNSGRFPSKFGEFYKTHPTIPTPLCPARPGFFTNTPGEEFITALDDPTDPVNRYIYCGAGRSTSDPKGTVILFDKLENHENGINVLYNDGTVEWLSADAARAFINRQNAGTQPTSLH